MSKAIPKVLIPLIYQPDQVLAAPATQKDDPIKRFHFNSRKFVAPQFFILYYYAIINHIKDCRMGKGRLEAFSDGVIAIIITIMVLEMKVPHGDSLESLKPVLPVFIGYILSFVNIGIYWNNHHHMMHAARNVNGIVLWANVHLLFWLSLIPFVTGWMGENHFTTWPVALYGIVLFMAGVAYYFLAHSLARLHGKDSALAAALGKDWKGIISVVIYAVGIGLCFINPWFGFGMYAFVAAMWFIPDKRIENRLLTNKTAEKKM